MHDLLDLNFFHRTGIWRLNLDGLDMNRLINGFWSYSEKNILYQEPFLPIHDWWHFLKDSLGIADTTQAETNNVDFYRNKIRNY